MNLHNFSPFIYEIYQQHKSFNLLRCIKCKQIVFKSRPAALKELNKRLAKDREEWRRNSLERHTFKNSLKYYLSIGNDINYNKDGINYYMNHKGQIIKKSPCKYSDDDILAKDIIK